MKYTKDRRLRIYLLSNRSQVKNPAGLRRFTSPHPYLFSGFMWLQMSSKGGRQAYIEGEGPFARGLGDRTPVAQSGGDRTPVARGVINFPLAILQKKTQATDDRPLPL